MPCEPAKLLILQSAGGLVGLKITQLGGIKGFSKLSMLVAIIFGTLVSANTTKLAVAAPLVLDATQVMVVKPVVFGVTVVVALEGLATLAPLLADQE